MWADRSGVHHKPLDKTGIDVVCLYCPETDECYYIRPRQHRESVTLRIAPSKNGQKSGVLLASTFRHLSIATTATET